MQNYFAPVYFDELSERVCELKPYNSKYCSDFVLFFGLQLIFGPFNFAVLFGLRNKGHANIKGLTVVLAAEMGLAIMPNTVGESQGISFLKLSGNPVQSCHVLRAHVKHRLAITQ